MDCRHLSLSIVASQAEFDLRPLLLPLPLLLLIVLPMGTLDRVGDERKPRFETRLDGSSRILHLAIENFAPFLAQEADRERRLGILEASADFPVDRDRLSRKLARAENPISIRGQVSIRVRS